MAAVFKVHSDLGPLCDERIYQEELAFRLRALGSLAVATEVPNSVSFGTFEKVNQIDLLLNDGVVYELKAARCLTAHHQKQALQYMLLLGLHHGKLVNFRPATVEHRFVSTRLTPQRRHEFTVEETE